MGKRLSVAEQMRAVGRGEVSPVALVDAALAAIERTQPELNACTHVLADAARIRARQLEAAATRGPLRGVPIAVKELFDVGGVPTTGCSEAYAGRVATSDAALVATLSRAEAIVVAKTNQHELACGATGLISSFGPVRNPWGPDRLAGGSSGGSAAAVASGVVPLAFGSDTGGSLRIPASFCGVSALKPTHGAVGLEGTMPVSPALDTVGPIAATIADCALAFGVLAGTRLPVPPLTEVCLSELRLGLPAAFFSRVHAGIADAVQRAASVLEELGAIIEEVEGPELDEGGLGFEFVWADFADAHRSIWDDPKLHPEVAALLDHGRAMGSTAYGRSRQRARQIAASFRRAFRQVDYLLVPTTPYPAPAAGAEAVTIGPDVLDVHGGGPSRLTVPVNLAGLPALTFPVGFSSEGLPLGAQLVGRRWSEPFLLAVGSAYQKATDWHGRLPPPESGNATKHDRKASVGERSLMNESELHGLNPFDLLDEESERVKRHFGALEDWTRPTRCEGWTVRDMLSHLAGVEVYNRACLDGSVERLFTDLASKGVNGADDFNAWFVRLFEPRPVDDVLGEWAAANAAYRAEMRARGTEGFVATSVGAYPVRLQAFHLAMEYATHADDIGAPVDPGDRLRRRDWRARFARFAIPEQGHAVEIRALGRKNVVRAGSELAVLSDEELVEASQGRLANDHELSAGFRAALNYLP